MDFFLRRYLLAWKLAKLGSIVSCLQEGVEKQLPTLLTFSTKDDGNRGTLKMRDMKLRDMKMRHQNARVENARHEFSAPDCRGGKCET